MPLGEKNFTYQALDIVLEYAHLVPDQKKTAVERMERAFGEGSRGGN
jgi:hypothetical protein